MRHNNESKIYMSGLLIRLYNLCGVRWSALPQRVRETILEVSSFVSVSVRINRRRSQIVLPKAHASIDAFMKLTNDNQS